MSCTITGKDDLMRQVTTIASVNVGSSIEQTDKLELVHSEGKGYILRNNESNSLVPIIQGLGRSIASFTHRISERCGAITDYSAVRQYVDELQTQLYQVRGELTAADKEMIHVASRQLSKLGELYQERDLAIVMRHEQFVKPGYSRLAKSLEKLL